MSKRKLLLADDSMTIQKVVNLTFADEGIEVFTVGNGSLAIEKLSEIEPDLVLADVHMPGLTGYEVCEQIKMNPRFQHVPVMLLVGSFEPFDEQEAERVGANDYLTKPFQSIRQLIQKVTTLLDNQPTGTNGLDAVAAPMVAPDNVDDQQLIPLDNQQQEKPKSLPETVLEENYSETNSVFDLPGQEMSFGDNALDDEMIETNFGNNAGNEFADSILSNQFDSQNSGAIQTSSAVTEQYNSNENWTTADDGVSSAEMRPTEPLSYVDIQEMNSSMLMPTAEPEKPADWQSFEFEANVVSEPTSPVEFTQTSSTETQTSNLAGENSSDELDLEFDSPVSQQQPEEQFLETSDFEFGNLEETPLIKNRAQESADFNFSTAAASGNDFEPLELDLDEMNLLQIDDENSILDLQTEESASDVSMANLELPMMRNDLTKTDAAHLPNNALSQAAGQAVSSMNLDFPPHVIEAIAQLVIERLSDKVIEKIAWEIVPDRFDLIVRQQIENRNR